NEIASNQTPRKFRLNQLMKRILSLAIITLAIGSRADVYITEVHPSGSGNGTYAADWFELYNAGPSAVDLTGWRIDDSSPSFGTAVALRGVPSLAPGQTAIFLEGNASGTTDSTIDAAFLTAWFGGLVPAGFLVGNYGGSGVGLSTTSDAVNIFNSV